MSHVAENGDLVVDNSAPIKEDPEVPQDVPKLVTQLKFNSVGLPIGPGVRQAINKLGTLIRSQIPTGYTSWRLVPNERKNLVCEDLKTDYNFTDSQKVIIMRKGANTAKSSRRKFEKVKLKELRQLQTRLYSDQKKIEDWNSGVHYARIWILGLTKTLKLTLHGSSNC